jgi:uncharacterized protein
MGLVTLSSMDKKKIIVDTNFLLIPGQFHVDIFSEIDRIMTEPYELCMVEKSVGEIENITRQGKQVDKFAAKLALVLSIQKSLKRLPCSKEIRSADDAIVEASDSNTYVATQDKLLRGRVIRKGAKIIALRQKKYLVIE